jgi:hypothetical protein
MGVTEEEATEAMQVAMTVAATRTQVLLNNELAKLGAPPGESASPAAPAVPSPQRFTAAEVVPQAGGG